MNNILELDKQRYFGGKIPAFWQFFRKAQINKTPFLHKFYKKLFEISAKKNGIEFSVDNEIGYGFYIGHPYGITINPNVVLETMLIFIRELLLDKKIEEREKELRALAIKFGLE